MAKRGLYIYNRYYETTNYHSAGGTSSYFAFTSEMDSILGFAPFSMSN
jgi:hypothetical protein